MIFDWKETTIGEQVTLQRGIDITKAQQKPGKVPVVSSGGISSYHDVAYAQGPGVILGRKGTVGSVFYIPEDYWPHDTTLWVKDFHGNEPRYVYYFFLSLSSLLASLDVGSANPALNRNHVHPIKVNWPEIAEQRAIAHILGALDDKIELNRRMNQTLEALARAIFKSWFVDFDPVTARAEGRRPVGMSDAVAGLFPDKLQETNNEDFAEIPAGWMIGNVGDIGQNIRRGVNPNEVEPDIPYIGLEHMPRRSIELSQWGNAGSVTSNKFKFKVGEILFGKLRPYFHKVGIAATDGVCSTDVLVVTPKQLEYFGVLLGHLSSVSFINYVDAASEGTKMPRTSWDTMARYPIVIPDEKVSTYFTDLIKPMVDKIRANIWESRTLETLRDTLLPKLLSGAIRLGPAQEIVENLSADLAATQAGEA